MTSIKRGVSLYSLQDAYGRGGLGLEGTIAAVEQMGTQGIEFLSDQMLTGAQKASENTLREWDAIIERHPLDLVSNDIFVNSTLYRNRTLTLEEQAELLSSDLRLANRLGFRLVRVVSRTDPRLINGRPRREARRHYGCGDPRRNELRSSTDRGVDQRDEANR